MKATHALIIAAYVAAITAANLTVAHFGPWATPINAFILIAFTLVARDVLHESWRGRARIPRMLALILGAGVISYALNPDSSRIALASAGAFIISETLDWFAYSLLDNKPWMVRSNGSNIVGAITDSIFFPLLAFGLIPSLGLVMLAQVAGKWTGGLVWSLVLKHTYNPDKRRQERATA